MGGNKMTLYDVLAKTKYYQKLYIYVTNAYDQNIPIYAGERSDALIDDEDKVFWHLMDEVTFLSVSKDYGIVIRLKNENYNKRAEELYHESYVKKWSRNDISSRPYKFSAELEDFMIR